jgi:outer membrane translocation and assembly module TamA
MYDYQVNSLDKKHFPDKGTILQITLGTTKFISGIIKTDTSKAIYKENNPEDFSFKRFFSFFGNIRHYFSPTDKLSLAVRGNVLYIPGYEPDFPAGNYYLLGGPESLNRRSISMIGFHSNEIAIGKLALIGNDIDFEIFENFHINFLANIAVAKEPGASKDLSLLAGYGLSAGYMTLIGPLKVGLMHGFSNRERYFKGIKGFISIGYCF